MTFAFTHRKNVDAQVRATASEQIDKALGKIAAPRDEADKTVHSLRRICKKLRGLVRLVGPRFAGADKENGAFRKAAASLSQARDAAVMVETFAHVLAFDRRHGDARISPAQAEALSAMLAEQARQPGGGSEDPFARFGYIFAAAARRIDDWSFDGRGFDILGDGLTANYRQFRKRLAQAQDEPIAEHLHEWRKTAKYHGHHVNLLRRSAPELLRGRQAAVDDLGDLLGEHHNLAVLQQTFTSMAIKGPVIKVLKAQQDELAAAAFTLGRQLAAGKPEALRRRFQQYWSLLPGKP
ncbi:MAG: hypothetical protein JWP99_943 [Devosia sp.]|nr:hypothetical protein [Devosia sp.]